VKIDETKEKGGGRKEVSEGMKTVFLKSYTLLIKHFTVRWNYRLEWKIPVSCLLQTCVWHW